MMAYHEKFVATVKVGGKILREREKEHVYLPFGSEYSIMLKNLNTRKALVTINVDGQDILDGSSLIIGPKQTTTIERFIVNGRMDKGPRLKFIEKTAKISEYRGDRIDDGIIEINYQFEVERRRPPVKIRPRGGDIYGMRSESSGVSDATYSNQSSGDVSGQSIISSTASNQVTLDSLSDDGITVHGSESNQQFTYGYIGALEHTVYTICLKLHGTSGELDIQQPLYVQRKLRCPTCGTSNSSRSKFCGECSTSLVW